MKNKISDLRNHMFAALERLSNEDMDEEQMKHEIDRSRAISEVGKVIVESAKTEILYVKMTTKKRDGLDSGFIDDTEAEKFNESKHIERPKAEYSNAGHLSVSKNYADEQ